MSQRIRLLEDHYINQIAAGEVIENSASVVKELLDNAIDSGAHAITIELEGGGRQLIRVSDNGCGMGKDDALLCLERHATSKIRSPNDLLSLTTMGFRGEALPSIGSIAKLSIHTAEEGGEGTLVTVEGGKLLRATAAVRDRGTTVEVRNLFFNVPARRKFQRSPALDVADIQKIVSLATLAYPALTLELRSHGEMIFQAKGAEGSSRKGQIGERLEGVLGKEFMREAIALHAVNDSITITGFLASASLSRPNRTGQTIIVNQRPITSPSIAKAVRDGYGTLLAPNRYPLFHLDIEVPPDAIDVNVHPQKKEIRFHDSLQLERQIVHLVSEALHGSCAVDTTFAVSLPAPTPSWGGATAAETVIVRSQTATMAVQAPLPLPLAPPSKTIKLLAVLPKYLVIDPLDLAQFPQYASKELGGGLALLHTRAARRRIAYEALMKGGQSAMSSQPLLIPYTLELPKHEATLIRGNLATLEAMGIHLHETGPNLFSLSALPPLLESHSARELLSDLIETLSTQAKEHVSQQARLAAVASRAISTATPTFQEALLLIERLLATASPLHCPRGEPIVALIPEKDLRNLFH